MSRRTKRVRIPSVGSGLAETRVRSTRLAWGASVWRQAEPGLTIPATDGKSVGGEKLNHERPNRIGKEGLASEVLRRRSRIANICVEAVPRASVFVGGNPARRVGKVWPAGRRHIPTRTGR